MEDKYLPIGTIIELKNNEEKLLFIVGYHNLDVKNNVLYDYAAYPYPIGIVDPKKRILFNHDSINKIVYMGYKTIAYEVFNKTIHEEINNKSKEQIINEMKEGIKNE